MQINTMAYSYIQFNIYGSSAIKTQGHSKFEKHAEMCMTTTGAGKCI